MLQKFLILTSTPELRSDPIDPNKNIPEVEISIPIDVYWEAQELCTKLKYAQKSGSSSSQAWKRLCNLVLPYIVSERDRLWFIKNITT